MAGALWCTLTHVQVRPRQSGHEPRRGRMTGRADAWIGDPRDTEATEHRLKQRARGF
ncbi:hypothetical protein SY2F82_28230 [Streptomyces sp. Y2F8-2]|nr:hypothetical protein SY2F82_28230 [Streptomyces sp. Y2F8-2]